LPKANDEDKAKRSEAIQNALKDACAVPEQVFDLAIETINMIRPIAEKGNKNAISDVGVAISSLKTALDGAKLNILINLKSIKDEKYVSEKKLKVGKTVSIINKTITELNKIIEGKL
jgi:formiminotetrahydrofolate cyclodeaminase